MKTNKGIFRDNLNYPKVGDKMYWEDLEGNIHEDICLKIEEENNPDLETMFFIYLNKTGGGTFITESDLINSNSKKVKVFLDNKRKEKINNVLNSLKDEDIKTELISRLKEYFLEDTTIKIINIITNE